MRRALVVVLGLLLASSSPAQPADPADVAHPAPAGAPLAAGGERGDSAAVGSRSGNPAAADSLPADRRPDLGDLMALDIDKLSTVSVKPRGNASGTASTVLEGSELRLDTAATTADLLTQAASVTVRRTSAINLDPRIRGFHSEQMSATANGMTELKTRIDIDSLFSQIDPGVVQRLEVIDGPYTSLYGPGFAFIVADLLAPPRYANGPEMHGSSAFQYGTNGQSSYGRQNLMGGGADWGLLASFGIRAGSDYHIGDASEFLVPASFQKWDGFFSVDRDLGEISRIRFDYVRSEINDLELPGVVYDINNSHNDQFNLRYVIQEDPQGPETFVLQSWVHQTGYSGDAQREAKQRTFYSAFLTLSGSGDPPVPANTISNGRSDSLGLRSLWTLGDACGPQWTVGADWRHQSQVYRERNLDEDGNLIFEGNVFGIPWANRDDIGVFTHFLFPISESVTYTVGGRLDCSSTRVDEQDAVVGDPEDENFYFEPGLAESQEVLGMTYATGKYKLPGNFVANAGIAFAMRNPSLAELYSDEPYVPLIRFGNSYAIGYSGLEPEKNLQFDLGLSYVGQKLSCGGRVFHSEIRDYINPSPAFIDPSAPDGVDGGHALGRNFAYFPPAQRTDVGTQNENADTSQAGYMYANVDRATISGVDFFVDLSVREGIAVGGELAYVHGTNHDPVAAIFDADWNFLYFTPTASSEPLPGIYPFHGAAWVRFFEPAENRWSVTFRARPVRQQERVAYTLSELPTPGFVVFDVRGDYRLSKNLRLTLGVENLLDRTYTEHGSLVILNRAGQAVFLKEPGVNVLFGVEWLF